MSGRLRLQEELLKDRRITEDEVQVIRDYIEQDGKLDMDDVKFLVSLLSDTDEVCQEFDDLFFPALKEVVLADGRIAPDEQFYLLKMLYSDGKIRECEKDFLRQLRDEASDVPAEFEMLCAEAFNAPATNWDVGGSPRA